MQWQIDKSRPICPQIAEKICVKIANGELNTNDKLPSVRDVAVNAGVNPNTVQKAFEQLEQQSLIYSIRGSGWYVSENIELAKQTLDEIIKKKTVAYFEEMSSLGVSQKEIINYVREWENE